jgi:hypothetical protein
MSFEQKEFANVYMNSRTPIFFLIFSADIKYLQDCYMFNEAFDYKLKTQL